MALGGMTLIGGTVVCAGVLFFLFCAALVTWYFFNQPKRDLTESAPEPSAEKTHSDDE
jgi:peptidoglycan/LPS O-acetylase OafA/YrhL